MSGETWKASELVEMARSLQPDILIDNRLAGSGESNRIFAAKDPPVYRRGFCLPGADHPTRGAGGRERPIRTMGSLPDHEQELGLRGGRQ